MSKKLSPLRKMIELQSISRCPQCGCKADGAMDVTKDDLFRCMECGLEFEIRADKITVEDRLRTKEL